MKRIISFLLATVIMLGIIQGDFVYAKNCPSNKNSLNNIIYADKDTLIKLEDGRMVTPEQLVEILDQYDGPIYKVESSALEKQLIEKTNHSSRNAEIVEETLIAMAGTWYIPGIGEIVIVGGTIIIAGVAIHYVGQWVKEKVINWLAAKAEEIEEVKEEIPSRLKDEDGNVKLEEFQENVTGKTAKRNKKTGWTIERDYGGHWGQKAWKLKNKSGERKATLDFKGRVLGK